MNSQENVIMTKSFQFAIEIIRFCEELEKDRKFVIANQLLKVAPLLVLRFGKLRTPKVRLILFINLKLLQKKQMKQNTGCCS